MQRVTEPELMDDPQQATAYAAADFDAPHRHIVATFDMCFPRVKLAAAGRGELAVKVISDRHLVVYGTRI